MKKILLSVLLVSALAGKLYSQVYTCDFQSANYNVPGTGYVFLNPPYSGTTVPGNVASDINPSLVNSTFISGTDHTPGGGKMLIVDGLPTNVATPFFWQNSAPITGLTVGSTYVLRFWIKSVNNTVTNAATEADIRISVPNGTGITLASVTSLAPLPAAGWKEIAYSFQAANTSVTIGMWNNNTSTIGNDFAIDDVTLTAFPVTISPLAICQNSSNYVTLSAPSATPPVTFTYSVDAGSPLTVAAGGSNTTLSLPHLPTGNHTYTIVSVTYGAPATTVTTNQFAIVTYSDPPSATITYAAPIYNTCNTSAQNVTLAGTGSYTGGAYTSSAGLTLNAVTGAITPSTSTPGTYTVTYQTLAASGCAPVTTTTAVTIAGPTATISGTTTIVSGNSAVIYFTGPAGATVNFTSSLGANSVVLDSTGNGSYSIPYLIATTTFSLVSVAIPAGPGGPACAAPAAGNATITVNNNTCTLPLVQVDIDNPAPICNPGQCTELLAHYSNIGATTDYIVSTIPYCPSFPFTGGTVIDAVGDDFWSPIVSLPFEFNFYGTCYDQVLVGTNGVITFDLAGQTPSGYCNWPFTATIPGVGFPIKNAIYGVYQDTNIATPPVTNPAIQNVNYYVLDTGVNAAPNRVFVANFNELPQFACNASVGFQTSQIVIHETTNIIEVFVNKRTSCTTWNSGSGLIGVQNLPGTLATVPPGRNTGTWPATNEAWRFYPKNQSPTPTEIRWEINGAPIAGSVNQNPLTVCPTTATTYTAIVKYTNCGVVEVEDNIVVDVAAPLPVNNPLDQISCVPFSIPSVIDINQDAQILAGVTNPGFYIISYFETLVDAQNFSNPIGDPTNYNLTRVPQIIYVRIDDLISQCYNVRPFTINFGGPGGTFSYPDSPYCNNITTLQPAILNSLSGGGTFSATPPGLIINSTSGAITPFGSTPGLYTVNYHIPANGICPAYDTNATLTIQACACALNVSPVNTTACQNVVMPAITFTVVGGGATGGAITAGSLPAGLTGVYDVPSESFIITGTPTAAGTFNITVSMNRGPVDICTASTTITVNPAPNAGLDGSTTICDTASAPINLFTLLTGGPQTGGAWVRSSGTGGTFTAATGTFTPSTGATTSTFTYTVTGTPPCTTDNSLATVFITAQPSAGNDGGTFVCESSSASISLFPLLTATQAGGTWVRATGTGGTFTAATGTFTPSAGATTSTFNYTVTGAVPCGNDVSTVTITIGPQPNAGTDGATTVCDSSTTAINLFSLLTGAQAGGVWTRTGGSGGTFNAAAGTYTPAAAATSGTFDYTIAGTAPCITDASTVTVTIVAQPNAGTDAILNICETNVMPINLFAQLTGAQSGGTWVRSSGTGGTFSAATGTFTPAAGATNSLFTYTKTGTVPCGNDTATVTVNINAQPNAGIDGGTTVCDSSVTAINLFSLLTGSPQATGTWTRTGGSGGTFNAAAGTYTPAPAATSGTFLYTVTGTAPCTDDTSTVTITVIAQPNAGADAVRTICDSNATPIDLFAELTGAQSGGTWVRNTGTGGTFSAATGIFTPAAGATNSLFTYTKTGTVPCGNDTATVTININPQPSAGIDGSTTICDSSIAPINLFSLLTGSPQAGGTWTRATGTGGTFAAATGIFTPASLATTSTFKYSVAATPPCITDESIVTVNINPQPNAGTDGNISACDNSTTALNLYASLSGAQTGGVWTRTSGTGGTFVAATGTFTPAIGATTSIFRYELTGVSPCINDFSTVTVSITPKADAGIDGATTICDSDSTPINLFALLTSAQSGGVWTRLSGSGGTFTAATGTFVPASGALTSIFTYTKAGTAPCNDDTSTVTVNINRQPVAGIDGSTSICDNSVAVINLFSLLTGSPQAGGSWTRLTGTGGTFNAVAGTYVAASGATTSTFRYELTAIAPCINDASVVTINITPRSYAGTDGATTICDNDPTAVDLFNLITGEQAGGTWARTSGTGGTFNAATGQYTVAANATASVFTYTVAGVSPCPNDIATATVTVSHQPNAGTDGNDSVCENDATVINLSTLITGEETGGVWTRVSGTGGTFNAGAGTFASAIGATTSTFRYTIVAAVPCVNDFSEVTVTINPRPTITGTAMLCVGTTSQLSSVTAPAGANAWVSSNTIVATISSAGLVNGLQGGNTAITYTDINGCSNTLLVTVRPLPTLTVTGNANPVICINTPTSIVYTIGGSATGATVTGLPAGVTASLSGTTVTISGSPTVFGNFPYHIETTGGCTPAAFANHSITVNPNPSIALANAPNFNPCIGANTTVIYNFGNGATGATVSGGGLPPGMAATIVGSTYQISGAPTSPGTYNYTIATTGGGCTPATITGTIIVKSNVTLTLSTGAGTVSQVICLNQALDPIRYATANGVTGITVSPVSTPQALPNGVTMSFNAGTGVVIIQGSPTQVGLFEYQLTTTGGCATATQQGSIRVNPDATITLSSGNNGQSVCINESITNISYSLGNNAVGATIFAGSLPDGVSAGMSGGQFVISGTPSESGVFNYTIRTTGGCNFDEITGTITVNPLPVVTLPDAFICLDSAGNPSTTALLTTGLSLSQYQFEWSDSAGVIAGATGNSYEALVSGTYSVKVTNRITGCANAAQTTVTTSYAPQIVTTTVSNYFSEVQLVTVNVQPAGNYLYSLDNGAWQTSNQFYNLPSGYHIVHVKDKIGCGSKDSDPFRIIDYPKFFTPNGDGYNETWNIPDLSDQQNSMIYIFDRYGKLMKQISPQGTGWDGTYNGQAMPATDYWFKVFFQENGLEQEFKAHFSLKR